jgi:metal-responsive CopG/Arc/MetJ family transcriptional regulator
MSNVAKVACSIDAELLARVESIRKRTGESRSAFISRALRILTTESARAQAVSRYVEAYKAQPETAEDVQAARRIARRTLANLDWDDT